MRLKKRYIRRFLNSYLVQCDGCKKIIPISKQFVAWDDNGYCIDCLIRLNQPMNSNPMHITDEKRKQVIKFKRIEDRKIIGKRTTRDKKWVSWMLQHYGLDFKVMCRITNKVMKQFVRRGILPKNQVMICLYDHQKEMMDKREKHATK